MDDHFEIAGEKLKVFISYSRRDAAEFEQFQKRFLMEPHMYLGPSQTKGGDISLGRW